MKKGWKKGSATVEGAIWIPILWMIVMWVLRIAVGLVESSIQREKNALLESVDVVKEFYGYQILEEVGEELEND